MGIMLWLALLLAMPDSPPTQDEVNDVLRSLSYRDVRVEVKPEKKGKETLVIMTTKSGAVFSAQDKDPFKATLEAARQTLEFLKTEKKGEGVN
jgi:hypothetical protein